MINSRHAASVRWCKTFPHLPLCSSYCEREFRDCRLQTCYVQSPAYPGLYPRALKCRYRLQTRQPFIKLYLQNEQFAVDGQRWVRDDKLQENSQASWKITFDKRETRRLLECSEKCAHINLIQFPRQNRALLHFARSIFISLIKIRSRHVP